MNAQSISPFAFSVESGKMATRQALDLFFEALGPLNLDVEEKGTIELVLAEILNNIVEHAYPPSDAAGPISVECKHQSDGLIIAIKDQGRAMPNNQMPLGNLSSLDVELDDMPEGGFGWFLIQHLARDVTYKRVGLENHLNMRLAVAVY